MEQPGAEAEEAAPCVRRDEETEAATTAAAEQDEAAAAVADDDGSGSDEEGSGGEGSAASSSSSSSDDEDEEDGDGDGDEGSEHAGDDEECQQEADEEGEGEEEVAVEATEAGEAPAAAAAAAADVDAEADAESTAQASAASGGSGDAAGEAEAVRAPSGRRKAVANYKDLIEKGAHPSPPAKPGEGKPPKAPQSRGGKVLKGGYKSALAAEGAKAKQQKQQRKASKFFSQVQAVAAAALGGQGEAGGGDGAAGGPGGVQTIKVPKPKNKKKRFTLQVLTSGAADGESLIIGGAKPGSPRFVLPPNFNKYSRKQRRRLLERQAEAAAKAGADAAEVAETMLSDPLLARVLAEQGARDVAGGGSKSKGGSAATSTAVSPRSGEGKEKGGKKKAKAPTPIPLFVPDVPLAAAAVAAGAMAVPPGLGLLLPPLAPPLPPPPGMAGAPAPAAAAEGTPRQRYEDRGHAFPPAGEAADPQAPPPHKPLEELVRVAADPAALAASRVLDDEDVPCDEGFAWDQLNLPRLPVLPPPPNASASKGEPRIEYSYYHYVTDSMWTLAGRMHARLGPELARLVLGEAVASLPSAEAAAAWEPPTPEEDSAMVIPPLGTVFAPRKRGTEAEVCAMEEDEDDVGGVPMADLGEAGSLRALWAVPRPVAEEEGRPAKRAARAKLRGSESPSKSPVKGEGGDCGAGEEKERPVSVFRCEAPEGTEEEGGRQLLPVLRLRAVVDEGSRALTLQSTRAYLPTVVDGEKEEEEGQEAPWPEVEGEEEKLELKEVDKAVGRGGGGLGKEQQDQGQGRLLRFWETGLLAPGRQDRRRERAEEKLNGGGAGGKRASTGPGMMASASSATLAGREDGAGDEGSVAGGSVASGGGGGGASTPGVAGGGRKRKRGVHPEVGEDEVLSLLAEAQRELLDVMRRNLGAGRRVYEAMLAAFEGGKAAREKRGEERALVRKYAEALARAEAEEADALGASGHSHGTRAGWAMDGVEEVNTECNVCHRSEAGGRNSIVFCDTCNMPVHTFCYCVATLPAGSWHCQPCEGALLEQEARQQRLAAQAADDSTVPSPPALPAKTSASCRCALCHGSGGAVRRAERPETPMTTAEAAPAAAPAAAAAEALEAAEGEQKEGEAKKEEAAAAAAQEPEEEEVLEWAHVECCRWLGLIDGRTGHIPALAPRLRALRRLYGDAYKCGAERCREPHAGGLVPCSAPGCTQFFHVSCGRRNGHEMYHGSRFGQLAWVAHCGRHTDARRFANTVRRVEASYEPTAREMDDVNPLHTAVFAVEREGEEEARRRRPWAAKAPPALDGEALEKYEEFRTAAEAVRARERAAEARRREEEEAVRRQRAEQAAAQAAVHAAWAESLRALPSSSSVGGGGGAGGSAAAGGGGGSGGSGSVGGGGGEQQVNYHNKKVYKRGPYRRTRVRTMLTTLQEHGVKPPKRVVDAADGSAEDCEVTEEWVLAHIDGFAHPLRARLLVQDEVLRGLYEQQQKRKGTGGGAGGGSGGGGGGGGGGKGSKAQGSSTSHDVSAAAPAAASAPAPLPPDAYLPPPPPPIPLMALAPSLSDAALSASVATGAGTEGAEGEEEEGGGCGDNGLDGSVQPGAPTVNEGEGEGEEEDVKPVLAGAEGNPALPLSASSSAAAGAPNDAPLPFLPSLAPQLSGTGGDSSVTTASVGGSSVHSGSAEGPAAAGAGVAGGKKKRKPPSLGPDGQPKKRRAPPGGPYFDPPELDANGQLKPPRQKGYRCEGCGAVIGTTANLDRHRTKSCPVLVKGKPRPPSLGDAASLASSSLSGSAAGGAGAAAAPQPKRSQKKKKGEPVLVPGMLPLPSTLPLVGGVPAPFPPFAPGMAPAVPGVLGAPPMGAGMDRQLAAAAETAAEEAPALPAEPSYTDVMSI